MHRSYIVRVEASLIEHCPLMFARHGDRLNKRLESVTLATTLKDLLLLLVVRAARNSCLLETRSCGM